jgi:hypothetical protein
MGKLLCHPAASNGQMAQNDRAKWSPALSRLYFKENFPRLGLHLSAFRRK